MNVLIGTPMFGGKCDLDYLNTILDCHRLRLPITVMGLRNESLITRGRNTILSYFLSMSQFTHLLFIDADMGVSGDDIHRLLSHGKDVIGAPVRLKGNDADGSPVFNVYPRLASTDLLQQVSRIGTAILCLSRRACEALAKDAPQYHGNPLTRGTAMDVPHYDVFRCGVRDGEYRSEDYWVCADLLKLGFQVWCDWGIHNRHWGNECYAT